MPEQVPGVRGGPDCDGGGSGFRTVAMVDGACNCGCVSSFCGRRSKACASPAPAWAQPWQASVKFCFRSSDLSAFAAAGARDCTTPDCTVIATSVGHPAIRSGRAAGAIACGNGCCCAIQARLTTSTSEAAAASGTLQRGKRRLRTIADAAVRPAPAPAPAHPARAVCPRLPHRRDTAATARCAGPGTAPAHDRRGVEILLSHRPAPQRSLARP